MHHVPNDPSASLPTTSSCRILPFLKWAGGKRWLPTRHSSKFPQQYSTYIEPFLGSAAIYFYLQPEKAILSDSNERLILTYVAIRKNWRRVQQLLSRHHGKHCEAHYYNIRSRIYIDIYHRAAQFIYLNRTCWNGLYRVNRDGTFNVPIGTKTQVLLETDRFDEVAKLLVGAELNVCDFEESIDQAKRGDFIFADPPYTAMHKQNGFVKYTEHIFSWSDQVRLYDTLIRAKERGAHIVLTNGDHECIRELFSPLGEIFPIRRSSVIAARPQDRRTANEIVVCA